MSRRIGRPKKVNGKRISLGTKVGERTFDRAYRAAQMRCGSNMSALLRLALLSFLRKAAL